MSDSRGMNAAQARAVTATFTYVNELLDGVVRIARGELTPFDKQRMDLTPEEARSLEDMVAVVRQRMLDALVGLGVSEPEADGSARWGVRTSLFYADMALSELTERHLRAYGAIDDGAAQAVAAAASDLRGLITEVAMVVGGPPHASEGSS